MKTVQEHLKSMDTEKLVQMNSYPFKFELRDIIDEIINTEAKKSLVHEFKADYKTSADVDKADDKSDEVAFYIYYKYEGGNKFDYKDAVGFYVSDDELTQNNIEEFLVKFINLYRKKLNSKKTGEKNDIRKQN